MNHLKEQRQSIEGHEVSHMILDSSIRSSFVKETNTLTSSVPSITGSKQRAKSALNLRFAKNQAFQSNKRNFRYEPLTALLNSNLRQSEDPTPLTKETFINDIELSNRDLNHTLKRHYQSSLRAREKESEDAYDIKAKIKLLATSKPMEDVILNIHPQKSVETELSCFVNSDKQYYRNPKFKIMAVKSEKMQNAQQTWAKITRFMKDNLVQENNSIPQTKDQSIRLSSAGPVSVNPSFAILQDKYGQQNHLSKSQIRSSIQQLENMSLSSIEKGS